MALQSLASLLQGQTANAPKSSAKAKNGREVFDFFQLVAAWPQIVGPRVALQTLPLKNTGTALTILVGHPTYAQQLSFMETSLRQKITTLFPSLRQKVQRFFFQTNPRFFREEKERQNKILANAKNTPRTSAPSLHPQSPTYQKLYAAAAAELKNVTDPEIKNLLISIYIQTHAP
jgi:hypothetical protein